jgi:hypothetical protein
MKRFQIKFSSQFLAIFLFVTRVKSKKICKPGQQDLTSQPFDLTDWQLEVSACGVSDDILEITVHMFRVEIMPIIIYPIIIEINNLSYVGNEETWSKFSALLCVHCMLSAQTWNDTFLFHVNSRRWIPNASSCNCVAMIISYFSHCVIIVFQFLNNIFSICVELAKVLNNCL